MIDMVGWETAPLDTVSREKQLKILSQDASACRKCSDIVCRRKQAVFGTGPVHARLVMFGEAPGAEEDDRGEPFVGAAGQLMDKILVASGLRREDVYIMNSLKCRPPGNRTPTDAEIENCRPYFEAQLEAIQPEYIICWGAVSVRAVLRTTESVGRLRGRFHQYKGAKVLVTYHPAYLLRNPDAKRLTWEDMKFLMRELEIPIPTPKKG
jgi:DNA polymerase